MKRKPVILSVAAALGALTGTANAVVTPSNTPDQNSSAKDSEGSSANLEPNVTYQVGQDLLGLIVTRQPDGTVIADHTSHASHASHASHTSGR